jgi:hypothetical protein
VSPDGATYYYHGETQETRWERPVAESVLMAPATEAALMA